MAVAHSILGASRIRAFEGASEDAVTEAVGVAPAARGGAEEVVRRAHRELAGSPVHYVLQQLVAQVEGDLDLAASVLESASLKRALEVDLPNAQANHLADPQAGEPEGGDHRPPPEPLEVATRLRL